MDQFASTRARRIAPRFSDPPDEVGKWAVTFHGMRRAQARTVLLYARTEQGAIQGARRYLFSPLGFPLSSTSARPATPRDLGAVPINEVTP